MAVLSNSTAQIVRVSNIIDLPTGGSAEFVIYCVDDSANNPEKYYIWRASEWEEILLGSVPGASGATVLSGASAPGAGLGADDDFYIDTTTYSIYGPKAIGAWGSATSLIGQQGIQGIQGNPGAVAPAGLTWRGTFDPNVIYSVNDTVSYDGASYWVFNGPVTGVTPTNLGAEWALLASVGATGPQGNTGDIGATGVGLTGADGLDGKTLLYGTIAPTTEGANGDFYIDTVTSIIYGPKASGTWPAGVSLIGATGDSGDTGNPGGDGTNGLNVLYGTVVPAAGVGVNGEFYINKATWIIYGPKVGGSWPTGVQLTNPWVMPKLTTVERITAAGNLTFLNVGYEVYDTDLEEIFTWNKSDESSSFPPVESFGWLPTRTNPPKVITADYTLTQADNGKILYVNSANTVIITPCVNDRWGPNPGFNCVVIRKGLGEVQFRSLFNLSYYDINDEPVLIFNATLNTTQSQYRLRVQNSAASIFCLSRSPTFCEMHIAGDLKV